MGREDSSLKGGGALPQTGWDRVTEYCLTTISSCPSVNTRAFYFKILSVSRYKYRAIALIRQQVNFRSFTD